MKIDKSTIDKTIAGMRASLQNCAKEFVGSTSKIPKSRKTAKVMGYTFCKECECDSAATCGTARFDDGNLLNDGMFTTEMIYAPGPRCDKCEKLWSVKYYKFEITISKKRVEV